MLARFRTVIPCLWCYRTVASSQWIDHHSESLSTRGSTDGEASTLGIDPLHSSHRGLEGVLWSPWKTTSIVSFSIPVGAAPAEWNWFSLSTPGETGPTSLRTARDPSRSASGGSRVPHGGQAPGGSESHWEKAPQASKGWL